jgi:hypothetical protein
VNANVIIQLWFVIQIDRGARDVAGMIRDPFKHGRHLGYRQDKAEIARSGLSQSKDIDRATIDVDFHLINGVVVIQNLASFAGVAFSQRMQGTS